MGGRGASFNIPVARSGGPRTTVGLPNSRRLRSGQLESLKTELLAVLHRGGDRYQMDGSNRVWLLCQKFVLCQNCKLLKSSNLADTLNV